MSKMLYLEILDEAGAFYISAPAGPTWGAMDLPYAVVRLATRIWIEVPGQPVRWGSGDPTRSGAVGEVDTKEFFWVKLQSKPFTQSKFTEVTP